MTLIIIVKSRYRTQGKEDEKENRKSKSLKTIQESEPKVKKEINEDNGGV